MQQRIYDYIDRYGPVDVETLRDSLDPSGAVSHEFDLALQVLFDSHVIVEINGQLCVNA